MFLSCSLRQGIMVNWVDAGFHMCLIFFIRTLVFHIGSLSCLTWTPDPWTLCFILATEAGHWTLCFPCVAAKGKEKVEIEREWEKMSNNLYYFTYDIICAKGTAFALTKNWEDHWDKHFTYIFGLFSKNDYSKLSSHSRISAIIFW